jgi:hypothetical protein
MRAIFGKYGFNRNTKRLILYGPSHLGGASFRHLYTEQGIGQIQADLPQTPAMPKATGPTPPLNCSGMGPIRHRHRQVLPYRLYQRIYRTWCPSGSSHSASSFTPSTPPLMWTATFSNHSNASMIAT